MLSSIVTVRNVREIKSFIRDWGSMSNILTQAQHAMIAMGGLVLLNNQHNELRDRRPSTASKLPLHRLPQRRLFRHSNGSTVKQIIRFFSC
jgi:hypothetical protein